MSAVLLLVGLQMLVCGPEPLPLAREIVYEEALERRRRGAFPKEGAARLLIAAIFVGIMLAKATTL